MCWIAIVPSNRIRQVVSNQRDRGLDSVWIITKKRIKRLVLNWYTNYKVHLKAISDSLCIVHHRKATIWNIKLENSHPFTWSMFSLVQNWTMSYFFSLYKDTYKKETDSETLLCYIEERVDNIFDIPKVLSELLDDIWNVIITDWKYILFYSDWARESYIDVTDDRVNSITNYPHNQKIWYVNKWYMILNYNWEIFVDTFYDKNQFYFMDLHYAKCWVLNDWIIEDWEIEDYTKIITKWWEEKIFDSQEEKTIEYYISDICYDVYSGEIDYEDAIYGYLMENYWVENIEEFNLTYYKFPLWSWNKKWNLFFNYDLWK